MQHNIGLDAPKFGNIDLSFIQCITKWQTGLRRLNLNYCGMYPTLSCTVSHRKVHAQSGKHRTIHIFNTEIQTPGNHSSDNNTGIIYIVIHKTSI